jgi:hypothetical protein
VTDYSALRGTSATLRDLLKAHITDADPTEADLSGVPIDLRSPQELDAAGVTPAVSVWLFRVALQPDLINAPPARVSDTEFAHHPLHLELSYLITALHATAANALALTGRIAQVLYDHRRLRGIDLKDSLAGSDSELHLALENASLYDTANLWFSLQKPFRLCIPLRVQGVVIDSHLPTLSGPRVVERTLQTDQIMEVV